MKWIFVTLIVVILHAGAAASAQNLSVSDVANPSLELNNGGGIGTLNCSASPSPKVLQSVQVSVNPQDIVVIGTRTEVTNGNGFNIALIRWVIAATSATATTGAQVTPSLLEGYVTPNMHHGVAALSALDTGRSGTVFYNVIGECSSSSPGTLTLEYTQTSAVPIQR